MSSKTLLREQKLEEYLLEHKTVKLAQIQSMFDISAVTARRLCASLEQSGKAIRCFGGLQYVPKGLSGSDDLYSYDLLSSKNIAEKKAIAEVAVTYVHSGEILYVSAGTTTIHFCLELAKRIESGNLQNITVMTNSFDNAEALSKHARVIITGGNYRTSRRDMAGMMCENVVQKAKFDRCFVGVDGVDIGSGLMTFDVDTARVDQLVIANSTNAYILTDSSKFACNSFISYATITKEYIITDSKLDPAIIQKAEKQGVNLIIV